MCVIYIVEKNVQVLSVNIYHYTVLNRKIPLKKLCIIRNQNMQKLPYTLKGWICTPKILMCKRGTSVILCPCLAEYTDGHFPLCGSHTVPSCLKESAVPLLRPPTSAPQKQSPAFSTQMEVTPYASQPLSLCQGRQACTRLSNNEEAREENGWCDCSLTCSVWLHQAIKDVPCASVQGVGSGACWILMPLNNGLSARSAPRSVQVFSGRYGTHDR